MAKKSGYRGYRKLVTSVKKGVVYVTKSKTGSRNLKSNEKGILYVAGSKKGSRRLSSKQDGIIYITKRR